LKRASQAYEKLMTTVTVICCPEESGVLVRVVFVKEITLVLGFP
jgi:hypothetical protein